MKHNVYLVHFSSELYPDLANQDLFLFGTEVLLCIHAIAWIVTYYSVPKSINIQHYPTGFTIVLHHCQSPSIIIQGSFVTCALAPLVKDENGDICDSKNYRAIAISSLLLKILDHCILILFQEEMKCDQLQYGFEKGSSTVQCTWTVMEVTSYFLRENSDVYCCLLDFSKAFDKVNFCELFKKLIDRKIPFIIIRLLL